MRTVFNNLFRQCVQDTTPLMEKYKFHRGGVCPPGCGFCKDERDEIVQHARRKYEAENINKK